LWPSVFIKVCKSIIIASAPNKIIFSNHVHMCIWQMSMVNIHPHIHSYYECTPKLIQFYLKEWSLHSHYTTMAQHQGTMEWGPCVGHTLLCLSVVSLKNVRFTTPIQQLYNNPSHEGGSHILRPTLMWEVVVQLLYWCCTIIKFLYHYCILWVF
jgi:hypothetical protein